MYVRAKARTLQDISFFGGSLVLRPRESVISQVRGKRGATKSRVKRDVQARLREGLGGKSLGLPDKMSSMEKSTRGRGREREQVQRERAPAKDSGWRSIHHRRAAYCFGVSLLASCPSV